MARKSTDKSSDELIVEEAHKEFARCEDRESLARPLWEADLRFANGDPDNGYQWDSAMAKQRESDGRPCLTINKVKQHNRQITNDARQNKPSIRVYPVDDGADKKTAEVLNGLIRHIEANSSADTAYDTAAEFAVDAGLGYWRVTTDYAADDSFDQEIYIKAIHNPLTVYLGRHTEVDGSDAQSGFVFEDIPKSEFEAKYPDAEAVSWPTSGSVGATDWLGEETIRICEYFKIVEESDTLCAGEDGEPFKLSTVKDKEIVKAIKADDSIKKRKVQVKKCKWYLIAGDQIIDRKDWAGKYIPIVRVVGDEVEINGKVERKGHTRAMKDAQRMYNYNSSAAIEYGALQTKTPIITTIEAIEGLEQYWENANTSNLAYLPYNGTDALGNQSPRPDRMIAPAPAQLFLQGMQTASEEMKMASGQYDASMGAKSNETSGRAIMARQREGDNATFHFVDNVARAIKFTGKILVDLIPKIYDTKRIIRILGEDGKEDKAHIDPEMSQAYAKTDERDPITNAVKEIFNPSIGRYDVIVIVGPSYGTKRQEAFQALTEMANRNPQLMQIAGDLIMKAADFPMSDQLAERLEKTLPPNLQDKEEGEQKMPPQIQQQIEQMQQQNQQLEEALQNAAAEVEKLEAKEKEENDTLTLGRYGKETERLKLLISVMPQQVAQIIAQEFGMNLIEEQREEEQKEALEPETDPNEERHAQIMQEMQGLHGKIDLAGQINGIGQKIEQSSQMETRMKVDPATGEKYSVRVMPQQPEMPAE